MEEIGTRISAPIHQSQHYFSALETLLMRSTNVWYLLTYLR